MHYYINCVKFHPDFVASCLLLHACAMCVCWIINQLPSVFMWRGLCWRGFDSQAVRMAGWTSTVQFQTVIWGSFSYEYRVNSATPMGALEGEELWGKEGGAFKPGAHWARTLIRAMLEGDIDPPPMLILSLSFCKVLLWVSFLLRLTSASSQPLSHFSSSWEQDEAPQEAQNSEDREGPNGTQRGFHWTDGAQGPSGFMYPLTQGLLYLRLHVFPHLS